MKDYSRVIPTVFRNMVVVIFAIIAACLFIWALGLFLDYTV